MSPRKARKSHRSARQRRAYAALGLKASLIASQLDLAARDLFRQVWPELKGRRLALFRCSGTTQAGVQAEIDSLPGSLCAFTSPIVMGGGPQRESPVVAWAAFPVPERALETPDQLRQWLAQLSIGQLTRHVEALEEDVRIRQDGGSLEDNILRGRCDSYVSAVDFFCRPLIYFGCPRSPLPCVHVQI